MKLPQWLPAALVVMTWLMICEPALVLSRIIIVTALLSAQEQPCARPTALGHCATLQSSQNGTILHHAGRVAVNQACGMRVRTFMHVGRV